MKIAVGDEIEVKRTFTQKDFDRFAALSGDDNPIHVDPDFAAKSRFGATVCHGMLLFSAIGRVLGEELPGPGTVQLQQDLQFTTPVYTGEEIRIRVVAKEIESKIGTATLETTITRPGGEAACQGKTVVAQDPALLGRLEKASTDTIIEDGANAYKGLQLGQESSEMGLFTVYDLAEYADLVGDPNPLYRDGEYANSVGLPSPMVPPGLIGGRISKILGTNLPGRGTAWLKQRYTFLTPLFPGNVFTASVRITRLRPEKNLVNLLTTCTGSEGKLLCTGEALVWVKDLQVQSSQL